MIVLDEISRHWIRSRSISCFCSFFPYNLKEVVLKFEDKMNWVLSTHLFNAIFVWLAYQLFAANRGILGKERHKLPSSTLIPSTTTNSTRPPMQSHKPLVPNVKGITFRAIYLIAAVSGIIVIYFIIRAICNRTRRNRTRRYGILNNDSRDNMEMRPLSEADDDDDDDLTLFDMSKRRGKR